MPWPALCAPVLVRGEPTCRILISSLKFIDDLFTLTQFLMPTFDLVVVGSGGGPYETNLSSSVSFFVSQFTKDARPKYPLTGTYLSHVTHNGEME